MCHCSSGRSLALGQNGGPKTSLQPHPQNLGVCTSHGKRDFTGMSNLRSMRREIIQNYLVTPTQARASCRPRRGRRVHVRGGDRSAEAEGRTTLGRRRRGRGPREAGGTGKGGETGPPMASPVPHASHHFSRRPVSILERPGARPVWLSS